MSLPNIPLFVNAVLFAKQGCGTAIADATTGKSYSYSELVSGVVALRQKILNGKSGIGYVVSLLAVWAAGGIAVPLCTTHPLPEQIYTIRDSQPSLILGHPMYTDRVASLVESEKIPAMYVTDRDLETWTEKPILPETFQFNMQRRALILYTSGTTGKPKGVVTTHKNIDAQVTALVEAWLWSKDDRIHHILPLHHVHGIINALTCALYVGATAEMHPKFDAAKVWDRWLATKLIKYYKECDREKQKAYSEACTQFRFQVSGSASLPTPLRDTWRKVSAGQVLLERYGMTEMGMALSQEYMVPERVQGTVGFPLKGVQVRLMAETQEGSGVFDKDVTDQREVAGMVQVKGPNVFQEYWLRPEATQKEFTPDGWFQTGDYGIRTGLRGYYRILGRASIDIIKTGGEKVSALEIERELLSCGLNIHDVAVIGVDDPEWGQRVAAVVVLDDGKV
ncbi:hypothetical protein BX666DRAFT_2021199 [Dichotomocladium elegans]|nr:hypothetical protein BX666DRAFT_2021199 [Dichotomocladium elegans]